MTEVRREDGKVWFRADQGNVLYVDEHPDHPAFVMYITEGFEHLLRECTMEEYLNMPKNFDEWGYKGNMKNFRNFGSIPYESRNKDWWKHGRTPN